MDPSAQVIILVSGTAASGSRQPALRSTTNSLAPVVVTAPPMPVHDVYASFTVVRNGRGNSTTPGEYDHSDAVVQTTAAGVLADAEAPGAADETSAAARTQVTRADFVMWITVCTHPDLIEAEAAGESY